MGQSSEHFLDYNSSHRPRITRHRKGPVLMLRSPARVDQYCAAAMYRCPNRPQTGPERAE